MSKNGPLATHLPQDIREMRRAERRASASRYWTQFAKDAFLYGIGALIIAAFLGGAAYLILSPSKQRIDPAGQYGTMEERVRATKDRN